MALLLPIKDFILALLNEARKPLSTAEIYEAFDKAGYNITSASIRGRINTLTYEGRILRIGHGLYAALATQLFNLIMSAREGAWDQGSARIDRSRFLEYTDKKIVAQFEALTPDILGQLLRLPTLLAYESGVGSPARVGD